ncbi:MAG: HD superfamily phosphodiesterase [Myxococcota bacterium]|jgi:HD superfamily phosphodiesterase
MFTRASPKKIMDQTHHQLLELLLDLDGVRQSPQHHPEGDALYHSLQVFQLAQQETDDRTLWAAALLHDVGKAAGGPDHDRLGAAELSGLVSPRVCWLVAHHLDLLRHPRRTRRRVSGQRLSDLTALRRWDLGGRDPHAHTLSPHEAIEALSEGPSCYLPDADDDHGVWA